MTDILIMTGIIGTLVGAILVLIMVMIGNRNDIIRAKNKARKEAENASKWKQYYERIKN